MKPLKRFSKLTSVLLLVSGSLLAQQGVIVSVAPGATPVVNARYQLNPIRNLDYAGAVQLSTFADSNSLSNFLVAAGSDPLVVSVELDQPTVLTEANSGSTALNSYVSTTVDSLMPGSNSLVNYFGNTARQGYVQQPAALLIRVPNAQAIYGTGSGIVADIDTGVDASHPLLANVFVPGYDFLTGMAGIPSEMSDLNQSTVALLDGISPAPVPTSDATFVLNQSTVALLDQSTVALLDQSTVALLDSQALPMAFGHGTMVAGLIHLVAPGAQIMPLRVFHSDGTGQLSDIVNAIYFAVNNGANVINMSFSSLDNSPALMGAIRYARSNNVICVAAAGNNGLPIIVYPAATKWAIGVGSTDAADLRSSFSNYGYPTADIGAPGEALITSYPLGQYAGVWGTSFSSALVSGAMALGTAMDSPFGYWGLMNALDSGKQLPPNEGLGQARLDVLSFLNTLNGGPISNQNSQNNQ